jgi:signal transduction histidine kinase
VAAGEKSSVALERKALIAKARAVLDKTSEFKHDIPHAIAVMEAILAGRNANLGSLKDSLFKVLSAGNLVPRGKTEIKTPEQAEEILYFCKYFAGELRRWAENNNDNKIIADIQASSRKKLPNKIKSALRREIKILKQIVVDLGRITEGSAYPLRMDNFDLNELLREVLEGVAGVTKQARLSRKLPALTGDRVLVKRAVLNIVNNAKEAMYGKRKRILTISTKFISATGQIELEISDTGEGMPPEILPHIFERYFRSRNS